MPERFRLHAVATQAAADRLRASSSTTTATRCCARPAARRRQARSHARVSGLPVADPRRGAHAGGAPPQGAPRAGVDHALVGGVLARRWALPNRLATAIEQHHSDDVDGEAALVRLADMLAHYGHGQTVNPKQLLQAARACGQRPSSSARSCTSCRRAADRRSGTLTRVRLDARGRGAEAAGRGQGLQADRARARALDEHGAHPPTHNTYAKLGAVDRAQAVLIATERGWI